MGSPVQITRLVTTISLQDSVKVIVGMKSTARFLSCLLLGVCAHAQELQKEADPALNCRQEERARRGDRILLDYTGLLEDGSTFDRGSADFVIRGQDRDQGPGGGHAGPVRRGEDHY